MSWRLHFIHSYVSGYTCDATFSVSFLGGRRDCGRELRLDFFDVCVRNNEYDFCANLTESNILSSLIVSIPDDIALLMFPCLGISELYDTSTA